MEWIKVKTNHILKEYTDLSDSEFRAWIMLMALTADLEHPPSKEQMLKEVHYKTIESLQRKLNTRSIDLQYIFNKVSIDVQDVLNKKKYWKEKKQKQRAVKENVQGDVQGDVLGTSNDREDKIREEERKEKKVVLSDDEWLKTLEDNPIYEGLEVRVLYGKMIVWCNVNGKKPTRKRFVNWLNREDKPIQSVTGNVKAEKKPERLPTQDEELAAFNARWDRDHGKG